MKDEKCYCVSFTVLQFHLQFVMFCVFMSLTHVVVPQREPAVPVHDKESEPTFSRTHNTSLGLLLNYGVLFKIPS